MTASTNGSSRDVLSRVSRTVGDEARTMARINSDMGGARKPAPWSVADFYRLLAAPPALVLALFFVLPILGVIWRGFSDPAPGLTNYRRLFADGPYVQSLWLTVTTALLVTVLCLITAYPVAYMMARARNSVQQLIGALVIIPLWTSVVIRSYAWMVVFQRRGILNQALTATGLVDAPIHFIPGNVAVYVGMVHIMLPFMILPLVANMRSIDGRLLAAAGILGATPVQGFLRVFLPLSMPGILAGSALVFMLSLGFYITPALLGGPRHMMAAVLIEDQANRQLDWGLASALATVLLVLTVTVYSVYVRLSSRVDGGLAHGR